MSRLVPHWARPSHPELLEIVDGSTDPTQFLSKAISKVTLPANAVFTKLTFPPLTYANKAYSTVQVGPTEHIELNSDIVFINHSCRPSLVFDMSRMELRTTGPLKEGDELTFFYPSTEWDMAQPFQCNCGERSCKGYIAGAKQMGREALQGYWLNPWIAEEIQKQ